MDDGVNGLLMTAFQLIARPVVIVPQPRKDLIHYYDILLIGIRFLDVARFKKHHFLLVYIF